MSVSPATATITTPTAALDHDSYAPLDFDTAVETFPPDARRAAAQAIGHHIAEQLRAGRSLFNVVHDAAVYDRIGADGRAVASRVHAVEADA